MAMNCGGKNSAEPLEEFRAPCGNLDRPSGFFFTFYAVANNLHRSLVFTVFDMLKWRGIIRSAFGGVTARALLP